MATQPDTELDPSEPVPISGSEALDDLVAAEAVVPVDFHADWCGPCKMLEPIVADIADETDAVVAEVDVDADQRLAQQYGVRVVPTLVLFADGEPVEQVVGVRPADQLRSLVARYAA